MKHHPPHPSAMQCGQSFLIHRIHGYGRLERRSFRYCLCLNDIPCSFQPPYTVCSVHVNGNVCFQPIACHERNGQLFKVTIPVEVILSDACGKRIPVASSLEERLMIRSCSDTNDCWKSTPSIFASVRLCSNCPVCCACEFTVSIDLLLEGYLLTPAPVHAACPLQCPPQKPWYPEPGCRC